MTRFASDDNMAEQASHQRPASHLGSPQPVSDAQPRDFEASSSFGTNSDSTTAGKTNIDMDESEFKKNFLRRNDYEHPLGFPYLAAWQQRYRSADCFRAFHYTGLRVISYEASRVAYLETKLLELDPQEETHLRGLTDYQKRLPGQPAAQNEFDALMAEIKQAWMENTTSVLRYQEMRQLPLVPLPRYKHMLNMIIDENMLKKEAYPWLDSPNDFVSVSEPLLPPLVISFLYSRCGQWLLEKIGSVGPEGNSRLLRQDVIDFILSFFLTLTQVIIIQIPIGFLFLGNLNKEQSFSLISGCNVVFSIVMAFTTKNNMHYTLLGVCAFSAVLFTISAQFANDNA